MSRYNFKASGRIFERIPRTSAELLQSHKKALGCLDMSAGALPNGTAVRVGGSLTIVNSSIDDDSGDPPRAWGWLNEGLPFEDQIPHPNYRFPNHFREATPIPDGLDPGNAFIETDYLEEVGGSTAQDDSIVGAVASQYFGTSKILEGTTVVEEYGLTAQGIANVAILAPMIGLPIWFRRLPEGTQIIDAWMECTVENMSHLTLHEHHGTVDGEPWAGGPDIGDGPLPAWGYRTTSAEEFGFSLLGKSKNGQWNHLGSGASASSGTLTSGNQCVIRCPDFFQRLLDIKNGPYVKFALYPAFANTIADPEALDGDQNTIAGLLWSIWNSMQSNNNYSDYVAGSGPGSRNVFESTSHILSYDAFGVGECVVQFKAPDGILQTMRIVPGGYYPALVDA
jgi:hypothetical protein